MRWKALSMSIFLIMAGCHADRSGEPAAREKPSPEARDPEPRVADSSHSPERSGPPIGSKDAWWSLEIGMSRDKVLAFLGPPKSRSVIILETWNYPGSGWVSFGKETGRLHSWDDPF